MPLEIGKYKGLVEGFFWFAVFAFAFIAMMVVMHPSWRFW